MNPLHAAGTHLFAGALLSMSVCSEMVRASEPTVTGGDAIDDAFDWNLERQFWSFKPPLKGELPAVKEAGWPAQRLDHFVLAKMEAKGLKPAPEAGKRTLIRRATFDVTGLPPTPDEVATFVGDSSPDAYPRLIERLLASPRFGERMASIWLPLARYAEDQAHQVGQDTKFFYPNAHKYRDWVIAAFNRDLAYDQFVRFQLAADLLLNSDPCREHVAPDDLAALGFLGLGPKYYNRNETSVMADEWEDRVDTVTRAFLGLTVACARCHDHKFDPISTRDYYALAGVFSSTRMINKTPDGQVEKDGAKAEQMHPDTLHIVEEGNVANLNVFIRGNASRKGPPAERRFLRILSEGEPAPFREGSGRRELAEAIVSRDNPLTARVMVNRVWAAFFGRGLVPSPSNLGNSGDPPSHPELLDDLAVRFVERGWSLKTLVREIVLSAAYKQSSLATPAALEADAANQWLSRMSRRRLTVEQWRDASLFLSGELKWEPGRARELSDPANHLRTVYGRISRLKLDDMLMQFDYPDANVHAEKRSVTTTPTQKLFMLNNPFVLERAKNLAARILEGDACCADEAVRKAYQLVFGREPDAGESALALEFLEKPGSSLPLRWEQYAQVLLASNELLYVD